MPKGCPVEIIPTGISPLGLVGENMDNLYTGIFINFDDPYNRWDLRILANVVRKVEIYCDVHDIEHVELHKVEDCRWSDPDNQRFNIDIRYPDANGKLIEQRLLMLKDEIINGEVFHKRHNEFYPAPSSFKKEVMA